MHDLRDRLVYQTKELNSSYNKSGVYIAVIESGDTETRIEIVVK